MIRKAYTILMFRRDRNDRLVITGISRPQMLIPKDNELVRTNRALLGVSIAAVVLLGPSFIAGYVWGYRTAQKSGPPDASVTALALSQESVLPSLPNAPKKSNRTAQTTSAGRGNWKESAPVGQADPYAVGQAPVPGQVYLQLVTAAKSRSSAVIETLRKNGFPVVASDVPEKPSLHRILIGPLHEGEVDKTRADLQSKGFPGDSAIERTF